jgi:hypothetical protein
LERPFAALSGFEAAWHLVCVRVCYAAVHFSLFKSVVGPREISCLDQRSAGRVLKLIHAKDSIQLRGFTM